MKSRMTLPLASLGIASAVLAGTFLAPPQTMGAVPNNGGTAPQQTRHASRQPGSDVSPVGKAPSSAEAIGVGASDAAEAPAESSATATSTESESSAPASSDSTPTTSSSQQSSDDTARHDQSQAEIDGWTIDFFDGFDQPLEETQWERYGWGDPPVGHGAMGVMSQRNSFTQNGNLVIRTQYENGQWSAGGAGSGNVFAASYGRWEVRAKFPQAKGIGYAFLLWPEDGSWPPEIDFAEGRVNGPEIMGVYHWDSDNKQEHRFVDHHDMSGWHTYGVIVEPNLITFTIDGQPWDTIEHPSVTDKRMWIGFQTGAMDPNGWQNDTETVDEGVPGPLTPEVADIEIDYVAHYTRS
ncbi:MAG: family 16 glycosylhydrolase [Propionibacteriaceae bacterium]|nr:family 16 glycosylhydrolase [Propionibacteriaceae bacterium]